MITKKRERGFGPHFKCEAYIKGKMCLAKAEYKGSTGHLVCGVCREMIQEQNPDISLKANVLGYEGQAKIMQDVQQGQISRNPLTSK